MTTIKEEECPIKDNGFEYLGNHYDCYYAIKRDIKMILQEAETSHKYNFVGFYDRNTLRPYKIRLYVDENNTPIYGMIIYVIDYKEEQNSRTACGGDITDLNLIIQCFYHTHIKKVFVGNKME